MEASGMEGSLYFFEKRYKKEEYSLPK